MPRPRLIHPVPVYIRKIDREQTAVMDDNLHEPVGQVRHEPKPIRLVAQHQPADTRRAGIASGALVENADGYLLFRTEDLRAAKTEIEIGDRVVTMGDPPNDWEVDYYIIKLRPMGHYQGHGGATLLRAYYQDRQPSRQRGDS